MINSLIEASNDYIQLLSEIEENEGVLTEEMEIRWDFCVSRMSTVSDQLANTLDYIDTAVEVAKRKKDRYYAKQKSLESFKSRLRESAKSLMINGVTFETDDRSVLLSKPKDKLDYDMVDIDTINPKYVKTKKELNKAQIQKDFKTTGEVPPGVEITTEQSLVVR